jgi:hypothetical protein
MQLKRIENRIEEKSLITSIKGDKVKILNNHGYINGWTNLTRIYGKVVKIEN